jgi:hypothetical protein
MLRQMQQLRGRVYLDDGALRPEQLGYDGRHRTPEDERSWHLLLLNRRGDVSACIWYLEHDEPSSIHELRVKSCPLTDAPEGHLRQAVHADLALARDERIKYSEVGGWAVAHPTRRPTEGVLLILATFGLSRLLGGALGVATATARHSSATMLRRLGLHRFEVNGATIEPYFDNKYDCEMEVLRYDTRQSSARYHGLIERLKARLHRVPVVRGEQVAGPARVPSRVEVAA